MFYAVNDFTVYAEHLTALDWHDQYDRKIEHVEMVVGVGRLFAAIGHENVRQAAGLTMHLGNLDVCSGTIATFKGSWDGATKKDFGLLSRKGLVLSIRCVWVELAVTLRAGEYVRSDRVIGKRLPYRVAYGRDREETRRYLEPAFESAKGLRFGTDEKSVQAMRKVHTEVCKTVLDPERWSVQAIRKVHTEVCKTVLDPERW